MFARLWAKCIDIIRRQPGCSRLAASRKNRPQSEPRPAKATKGLNSTLTRNPELPALLSIYAQSVAGGALRQGEILSDVHQHRRSFESLGQQEAVLVAVTHPLAIIATQDCDLDLDFKARQGTKPPPAEKTIPTVLLCEIVHADVLSAVINNRKVWETVSKNNHERYHVLWEVPPAQDSTGLGVPKSGIDFRRYFTVPTDELYYQTSQNARRRCRLVSPYLEHFAVRFRNYSARIALPASDE
jgi:hypothetical protein